jgi:hypothetical protein
MSLVVGSTEIDQGGGKPMWETPMQHGASLVRRLMQAGWPKSVLLNVNFPDCEPEAVKGSAATVQGQRDPDMLRVDDRIDTRGRAYYWLGIQRRHSKSPEGTDIWAVLSNLISVTPSVLILRTNKLSPASNPSSTFRGRQTPKHFLFPKWTEPKPTLAGWASLICVAKFDFRGSGSNEYSVASPAAQILRFSEPTARSNQ